MDEFEERKRHAIESLLENESLTTGLDDEAAQVLLDWGMDCAESIVASTAGLAAASVEDTLYPRMRALRRLMRRVNKWAGLSQSGDESLLEEVIELAGTVYGPESVAPAPEKLGSLSVRQAYSDPAQRIVDLRALIENQD